MSSVVKILTVLVALCALGSHAAARDVSHSDGPAVGLALGADGAGLGGYAAYYLAWPARRLGLMPHAGIGSTLNSAAGPGFSVGIGASYGRRHRLVIDVQISPKGAQELRLYGETLDSKLIYGVGLVAGWEWLSRSGFFMRGNLGPAFAFLPPIYQRSEGFTITGNLLSMGVKVW